MSELPRLLGVLAHEMRTPLAAILGYQELLAEGIYGRLDERGREPLDRIAYAARQLLSLIDGVQELSEPGSTLTKEIAPFEPAGMLRHCIALATADISRNVDVKVDMPAVLPQLTGDADRFCRSVELALSAAIKSSPGGTLQLAARPNGGSVRITIQPTGLSPDRDDPDSVVRQSTNEMSGAALRLAIARQLARGMNGELALEASSDGTTLILTFA